jgi:hypothetical protein
VAEGATHFFALAPIFLSCSHAAHRHALLRSCARGRATQARRRAGACASSRSAAPLSQQSCAAAGITAAACAARGAAAGARRAAARLGAGQQQRRGRRAAQPAVLTTTVIIIIIRADANASRRASQCVGLQAALVPAVDHRGHRQRRRGRLLVNVRSHLPLF